MGLCNFIATGRSASAMWFLNHELRYRVRRTHVGDTIDIIAEEL